MKDLNSDGINELILLDSNYVIVAIFTEIDGKAILVDTYNEWHTAWIDGNGLIHVQDYVFPGFSKDRIYSLYTIQDGNLISTLTVGYDYGGNKDNSKWYKLVNGDRTDLPKEDWDELYAEWALDIGDTKSYDYTKENANLDYVEISN